MSKGVQLSTVNATLFGGYELVQAQPDGRMHMLRDSITTADEAQRLMRAQDFVVLTKCISEWQDGRYRFECGNYAPAKDKEQCKKWAHRVFLRLVDLRRFDANTDMDSIMIVMEGLFDLISLYSMFRSGPLRVSGPPTNEVISLIDSFIERHGATALAHAAINALKAAA